MNNPIPGKNITIELLEEMFTNITSNTDWDMSKPKLWGYFFAHNNPQDLEAIIGQLAEKGYNIVGIFEGEKEDPAEPDQFILHIEKEETHTPGSLDARNDEFYIFAHENGIDVYDGMDVGPTEAEQDN